MAIEIFDPELVIARLQDLNNTFRQIGGAADFLAAFEDLKVSPAVFIVPTVEDAEPNSLASEEVAQRVPARFGVIVAERNLRDAAGREALKGLRPLRLAVAGKLHGWRPSDAYDVFEFRGGRVLRMDLEHLTLWWQDNYFTKTDWRTT